MNNININMNKANIRLKEIRKIKKMTQKEFGNMLKLSQNHISMLESGERHITDRILKDLHETFNVNIEYIKDGTGEKFINPVDELNIEDPEINDFMNLYARLDETERLHVKNLVEAALKLKK